MARGGGGGWSKRAVLHPPIGRWVVERGLPRLLSVSRTSGLQHSFFFLPFVRSLSSLLAFSVSVSPFSLWFSSLTSVPRSTLATLLFRDLVSAVAFLFFPFRPICSPSLCLPLPLANLAPVSPPFTRALFRLLLRSVPTACVSTAKSIDRNVFRSGRYEQECNRREWGGI